MSLTTYNVLVTCDDWECANCGHQWHPHACGNFTRRHYQFVGMMRIRNEARWIADAIRSLEPLCERIFILDDHSTDSTRDICRSFSRVLLYESPFTGLNEARDKSWLLDQIMRHCEPQWIVAIDGDEVLERRGPEIIRQFAAQNPQARSAKLKIQYLWNSPQQVRVDRIYNDFWRPSMFRPYVERPNIPDDRKMLQEFRFKETPWGRHREGHAPNLHCSSVPQSLIGCAYLCPVRLAHYGYMNRADRVAKLDYYTSIDWANGAEDSYRHMCQGDNVLPHELPKAQVLLSRGLISDAEMQRLVMVPAEASLIHAGPLEIIPWDEDAPWQPTAWARSQCL